MIKRLLLVGVCVLVAAPAWAGAIVTWEAFGTLATSNWDGLEDTGRVPDAGTPYHLVMSFDRSAIVPTPLSAAGSDCYMAHPVTGSMTIGGYDFAIPSGFGFTHAQLPDTNCSPGYPETQYLFGLVEPAGSPWYLEGAFMEMWYVDLLDPDGFPATPTDVGGGFQIRHEAYPIHINGRIDLQAVAPIDPAPVPEPGTLTLFGLGLAAIVRRMRGAHVQPRSMPS